MREIIQKVIETEAEAKRIVEAAQQSAERMLGEARKQAEGLQAQALNDARLEAERMIDQAIGEAEAEKAQYLSRAKSEAETQIQLEPAIQQHAVEAVLRCVCGGS